MKHLESKWAATKDELNLISQEHAEYKAKAKKVLFEKEKLISSFSETDLTNGGHRLQPAFSKAQLEQAMFVNLLICLFVDWFSLFLLIISQHIATLNIILLKPMIFRSNFNIALRSIFNFFKFIFKIS